MIDQPLVQILQRDNRTGDTNPLMEFQRNFCSIRRHSSRQSLTIVTGNVSPSSINARFPHQCKSTNAFFYRIRDYRAAPRSKPSSQETVAVKVQCAATNLGPLPNPTLIVTDGANPTSCSSPTQSYSNPPQNKAELRLPNCILFGFFRHCH